MSESGIIGIVGIGATLLGAVAGALITALIVGHYAKQDRLDARREAQRVSLTNTIASLREWSGVHHTNSLVMAGLNGYDELKRHIDGSVDSWTGTELIRLNRESARTLAASRVIVKDQRLADALIFVDNLREHSSKKLFESIAKSLREGGDKVQRAIDVSIAMDTFELGLKELELAARDVLAVPVR